MSDAEMDRLSRATNELALSSPVEQLMFQVSHLFLVLILDLCGSVFLILPSISNSTSNECYVIYSLRCCSLMKLRAHQKLFSKGCSFTV